MVDLIHPSAPSLSCTTFYEDPSELFQFTLHLGTYLLCQPFYTYYIIGGHRVQSVLTLCAYEQHAVWDFLASCSVVSLLVNCGLRMTR